MSYCFFKNHFSQYFGSLRDDATKSFKYRNSKKCFLEFSSVQENQPSKRYRLDEMLAGKVSLPKIDLSTSEIEKDAHKKGIIPVRLVLTIDGSTMAKNFTKQIIEFNRNTGTKTFTVAQTSGSYILYKHEFTSPEKLLNISVKDFSENGFPRKKNVVGARYLQELAHNQHCTARKLLFYDAEGKEVEKEIKITSDIEDIPVPDKRRCYVVYDVNNGVFGATIRLDNLLARKAFPREKVHV